MDTVDILLEARNLIAAEKNWTKYQNETVLADGDTAYCARGAVYKVCRAHGLYQIATKFFIPLAGAVDRGKIPRILSMQDYVTVVYAYNDTHTHDEVLAMFDSAIYKLKDGD